MPPRRGLGSAHSRPSVCIPPGAVWCLHSAGHASRPFVGPLLGSCSSPCSTGCDRQAAPVYPDKGASLRGGKAAPCGVSVARWSSRSSRTRRVLCSKPGGDSVRCFFFPFASTTRGPPEAAAEPAGGGGRPGGLPSGPKGRASIPTSAPWEAPAAPNLLATLSPFSPPPPLCGGSGDRAPRAWRVSRRCALS